MPIDPRTRGTLPPDPGKQYPALTSADMNNVYVALVDLGRRVSELEGQRTIINSQSITTGMVQTGAITTSTIAAGSITAAQIQVGNVVASIMTVGAVNAGHIDAASVRASVLDASVLTATNAYITSLRASILDAGVLTAASAQIGTLRTSILNSTQIVAQGLQTQVLSAVNAAITSLASFNVTSGTITADLIRTAASGSRVEVGATAGGIKGYNSSGVMTFGFDTTTGTATVGAIAVTGAGGTQVPASTLTGFVGGGNLLKDSSFESTDPALPAALWSTLGVSIARSTTQAFHQTTALRLTNTGGANGQAYTNVRSQHGVPITSLRNRPVVLSAWVYITGTDNTTPTNNHVLSLNTDAVVIQDTPVTTVPKNTWTRLVVKGTIPNAANDVYAVVFNTYTSGLNTVYIDGIQFEFGDAVTAYSPKADEIIYGSITAVEIAASSVDATRLNVSTLSAISANMGTITAGTITGATFQSSASHPKVAFDTTGFYTTDAAAAKLIQITAAGGISILAPTAGGTHPQNLSWRTAGGVDVVTLDAFTASLDATAQLVAIAQGSGASSYAHLRAYDQARLGSNSLSVISDPSSDSGNRAQAHVGNAAQTLNYDAFILDGTGASTFAQSRDGSRQPRVPVITTPASGFGTHYVNYNSSFRYWKDALGYVHVVGEINDDGTGLAALAANTLVWSAFPSDYRPTARVYFTVESNSTTVNHFLINTSGELRINDNAANSGRYSNFGHITFPTF